MNRYADLEIGLRRQSGSSYAAAFRYNSPGDDAEQRSATDPVFTLDPTALNTDDPAAYAAALSAGFFNPELLGEFRRFRTAAASQSLILRIRITIDPAAPELQAFHWETLRDPDLPADQPNASLFTGEQTIVSRFLASSDWRPIRRRAKGSLRALVVVANPANTKIELAPIDVAAELAAAKKALDGIEIVELAPGGAVPLNDLSARLRDGFDILYLVCHGQIVADTPYLYLDDKVNDGRPTSGLDLVQAIRELDRRPLLVMLASCQSAGKDGVGLAGLGPRLADAGVAAVIAMQGNIFMTTAAAFVNRFFKELLIDGQVDRAMCVARGEVRTATDYWMPALFMRLRNGCIWYEPGFGGTAEADFAQWKGICNSVHKGNFIPILGPELGEDLFGGTDELAANLADAHNFPLGAHERTDLAKVAQFIAVQQQRIGCCDAVKDQFVAQLTARLGAAGPGAPPQTQGQLLDAAVARVRADANHPYSVLSGLPASIYLNASYETLLLRVLRAAGKKPEPVFATWRGQDVPVDPKKDAAAPLPDTPWVYHIFGPFGEYNSMVLTEDDFFDYLISATRNKLNGALMGRLMESSLLFLGFRLDDWRFRVLFRMIVTQQGTSQLKDLAHVGVQVTPGEQSVDDVNRARKYLESYFQGSDNAPKISIYWGSPGDFLSQLDQQLKANGPQEAVPAAQGASNDWL